MEKWQKPIHRIIGWALIAAVLLIPCAFFGNPVSWALVWLRSNAYLDSTYPELDVKVGSIVYDFKHGGFYVNVISPTSVDTYFPLTCDGLGGVQYDHYASVTSGGNTVARHSKAYRALVDEAFRQPGAPFGSHDVYSELCTQAGIEYYTVTTEDGWEMRTMEKDFSLDYADFQLDQDYDLQVLGAEHGQLKVHAKDREVTIERAAELLLELKAFLDAQGVPFYAVEFWLSPVPQEGVVLTDADTICLWDFLYSDIYAEGLTERVHAAHQEYLRHLSQMNQ